jgi:hypothetical protein
VDSREIVVHEMKRHGGLVIVESLAEGVRVAPHAHPHCEVLTLDEAIGAQPSTGRTLT